MVGAKPIMTLNEPKKPKFLLEKKKQQVMREMEKNKINEENRNLLEKIDNIQWRNFNNKRGGKLSKSSSLFQKQELRYPITMEKSKTKFRKQQINKINTDNAV